MNILFATSEVAPLAKTGGLADVSGALPRALHQLGHDVTVVMPAYREALQQVEHLEGIENIVFDVPIGSKIVPGSLFRSQLGDDGPTLILVQQSGYFDRPALYGEHGQDYRDNCERFVFFCRAVLEALRLLELPVDVIHCNDWQTGLLPAYLATDYRNTPGYEDVASLLTIHNMAYQGRFWHWDMLLTGLDWKYFNWTQLEFHGDLNLLKAGLVFADGINTVSPTYAREIQEEPLGCGLAGVLRSRAADLRGILNGIDTGVWDPQGDPFLEANYSVDCWTTNKPRCKAALQQELGLPQRTDVPVIGMIGRLVDQKGWDLIAPLISDWAQREPVQWVILGTGSAHYHDMLAGLSGQFPDRVAARLEFSNALAHRIEAGSDLFLMPSLYEPCGLNQMYSLRYGTPPVVRRTGGLADTIADATSENLAAGTANGFSFSEYDRGALEEALQRACGLFSEAPKTWRQLVETGMRQDWSWDRSAREYVQLYRHVLERRRGALNVDSLNEK